MARDRATWRYCTCEGHDLDHVINLDVVAQDLQLLARQVKLRPPVEGADEQSELQRPHLEETPLERRSRSAAVAPALTCCDRSRREWARSP